MSRAALVVLASALLAACGTKSVDYTLDTQPPPSSAVEAATTVAAPASTPAPSAAPLPYYDPARDARADIDAALKLAAVDHKRVLIDFGADWCADCRVLARLYADPSVRPTLDAGYHLVVVDVGEFDRNVDVSKRYGNVIEGGIPALVVTDASGRALVATKDGSFANARTMKAPDVLAFLRRWAPGP